MDKQTMVKVDNVGIRFNLAKERVDSLKEYFLKFCKSDDKKGIYSNGEYIGEVLIPLDAKGDTFEILY